jgi:hypothetical protein
MTLAETNHRVELDRAGPPRLLVVVHTEEEFDWSAPFSRDATSVSHVRALPAVHELFVARGAKPTYVVDFPIAAQTESAAVIRQLLNHGETTLGTHPHPWVNPPYEEEVSAFNSYPGNLPAGLEREKIEVLTHKIVDSFGVRPTVYLAGRYGYGPNTGQILQDLGYQIDLSLVAASDFSADGGPDYSHYGCHPVWSDARRRLLRIPHTTAHVGFLCRNGFPRWRINGNGLLGALRVPGILARSGAARRLRLTPEGSSLSDMRRLTTSLVRSGLRVFMLSFHSPSLEAGHTPYVRSRQDADAFVAALDGYLEYFRDALGGVFSTPHEIRAVAQASAQAPASA